MFANLQNKGIEHKGKPDYTINGEPYWLKLLPKEKQGLAAVVFFLEDQFGEKKFVLKKLQSLDGYNIPKFIRATYPKPENIIKHIDSKDSKRPCEIIEPFWGEHTFDTFFFPTKPFQKKWIKNWLSKTIFEKKTHAFLALNVFLGALTELREKIHAEGLVHNDAHGNNIILNLFNKEVRFTDFDKTLPIGAKDNQHLHIPPEKLPGHAPPECYQKFKTQYNASTSEVTVIETYQEQGSKKEISHKFTPELKCDQKHFESFRLRVYKGNKSSSKLHVGLEQKEKDTDTGPAFEIKQRKLTVLPSYDIYAMGHLLYLINNGFLKKEFESDLNFGYLSCLLDDLIKEMMKDNPQERLQDIEEIQRRIMKAMLDTISSENDENFLRTTLFEGPSYCRDILLKERVTKFFKQIRAGIYGAPINNLRALEKTKQLQAIFLSAMLTACFLAVTLSQPYLLLVALGFFVIATSIEIAQALSQNDAYNKSANKNLIKFSNGRIGLLLGFLLNALVAALVAQQIVVKELLGHQVSEFFLISVPHLHLGLAALAGLKALYHLSMMTYFFVKMCLASADDKQYYTHACIKHGGDAVITFAITAAVLGIFFFANIASLGIISLVLGVLGCLLMFVNAYYSKNLPNPSKPKNITLAPLTLPLFPEPETKSTEKENLIQELRKKIETLQAPQRQARHLFFKSQGTREQLKACYLRLFKLALEKNWTCEQLNKKIDQFKKDSGGEKVMEEILRSHRDVSETAALADKALIYLAQHEKIVLPISDIALHRACQAA